MTACCAREEIRRAACTDTNLFMKGALNLTRELLNERSESTLTTHGPMPNSLLPTWTSGSTWEMGKVLERAFTCAQIAARLDPSDSTCQRVLGLNHCGFGEYEEAALHLETALSVNPIDIMAAHNMAVYLDFVGRPSEATTLVRKAMRLDPTHWVVLHDNSRLCPVLSRPIRGDIGRIAKSRSIAAIGSSLSGSVLCAIGPNG